MIRLSVKGPAGKTRGLPVFEKEKPQLQKNRPNAMQVM
jgi:hypothetical protein